MFDDPSLKSGGAVPNDLPVGEPEDIFAGANEADVLPANNAPMAPTALGAGVLRLRESSPIVGIPPASSNPESVYQPPIANTPPLQGAINPMMSVPYQIKKPSFIKELFISIIIVAAIMSAVGGAWWLFKGKSTVENSNQAPAPAPVAPAPAPIDEETEKTNEATKKDIVDDKVLFGEPIDSDGDGLDDTREQSLGTDAKNWDSDTDGLSDGDEINIWKTDPKNSDTDGDGFKDGAEVKNGYSPKGPGKLFEPPQTPTSTN